MVDPRVERHQKLLHMGYAIRDTVGELSSLRRGYDIKGLDLARVVEYLPDLVESARTYTPDLVEKVERYSERVKSIMREDAAQTIAELKGDKEKISHAIDDLYALQEVRGNVHRALSRAGEGQDVDRKRLRRRLSPSWTVIIALIGMFFGIYSLISFQTITGRVVNINSTFVPILGVFFLMGLFVSVLLKKFR